MIRIMLWKDCNLNCDYCFVKNNNNFNEQQLEFDFDKIKESLKLIDTKYHNSCELIGGEPLLYPDKFLEVVSYINDNFKKLKINIFTSLSLPLSDNFIKKLKSDNITINISYDGKLSSRNKNNYQIILENINRLKENNINFNIRFTIDRNDINNLYYNFKEISLLTDSFIFFFLKNYDYSIDDIDIIKNQLSRIMLDHEINNIKFSNFFINSPNNIFYRKNNFECDDEITILPNGKFTTCYVKFSSAGFDKSLVHTELNFKDHDVLNLPKDLKSKLCDNCLEAFGSCNKCPGNLLEYQKLNNKPFFFSYCLLINTVMLELMKLYNIINDPKDITIANKKHYLRLNNNLITEYKIINYKKIKVNEYSFDEYLELFKNNLKEVESC